VRRWTQWFCSECGEGANTAFYGPDGERGHYHDNPQGGFLGRIFHPAVPVEVVPLSEVKEVLLGEAALVPLALKIACRKWGYCLDDWSKASDKERDEAMRLARIDQEAALDAAFPSTDSEGQS
jgi:hypothetical protein